MRRPLYLLSLVLLAGCDPDLTVAPAPGADAASDVSVQEGPGPVTPENDGGASDGGGTEQDGSTTEEDSGGTVTTHKIDGDNDFKPSEKFVTSSTGTGYEGFIAWDSKNVYIGMAGNDIGAGATDKKWVLIYLDGGSAMTTTNGQTYGAQQPTLPFGASVHIGLKTDLSFVNKQKWDGANWADATATLIPIPQRKNGFMEVLIPRAAIGNPSTLKVHVSMINEANGSNWTYSAMPSSSLTDGLDPNYSKYFEFDLNDTAKAPNSYTAK